MKAWRHYVWFWDHREPAWSLALVRILVGAVVFYDLCQIARLDLIVALWGPIEDGGIGPTSYAHPRVMLYSWLGASARSAYLLFALAAAAALSLCLGCWTRLSALVLVWCSGQFSALAPDADRGIDALVRNALVVLVLADAGATWSIDARRRTGSFAPDVQITAWPRYLLIAQLVFLYFLAGIFKQSASWSALDGYSALFLVLNKPHYVRFELPHAVLSAAYPLLQVATIATLIFERSAPLVPLAMWLRGRPDSRLRSFVLRSHFLEIWIATGAFFHLALAALMQLGIFPWGCLALYPALFRPETVRASLARAKVALGQPRSLRQAEL